MSNSYIIQIVTQLFFHMLLIRHAGKMFVRKIHMELESTFKRSILKKYGSNVFSLPSTISVPGAKPALQTVPETILTQAFALCQKWQDWALNILFGPSVATCIVSSESPRLT